MRIKQAKIVQAILLFVIMMLIWIVYEQSFGADYMADPLKGFDEYGSMTGVAAWYSSIQMLFELLRVVTLTAVVFAVAAVLIKAKDEKRAVLLAGIVTAFDMVCLVGVTLAEKSNLILAPLLQLFLKMNHYPADNVESVQRVRENLNFFGDRVPVLILLIAMTVLMFIGFCIGTNKGEPKETESFCLVPIGFAATAVAVVRWIVMLLCMGNLNLRQTSEEMAAYLGTANTILSDFRMFYVLPIPMLIAVGAAIIIKGKKNEVSEKRITVIAVLSAFLLSAAEGIFLAVYGHFYTVEGQLFYDVAANKIILSMVIGLGIFETVSTFFLLKFYFRRERMIKMKKTRILLFATLSALALGAQGRGGYVQAAEVTVNQETFPDAHFRSYVSEQVDSDRDGKLSEQEIRKTTKIKIEWADSENIKDYQGIESFTELKDLEIHAAYAAEDEDECDMMENIKLDVSKNTKLTRFWCEAGTVEGLDLSPLTGLQQVELAASQYPAQDLTKCTGLSRIRVGKDVTLPKEMPELKVCTLLDGSHALDFHAFSKLQELNIKYTSWEETLDVKNMPELKKFYATGYIRQIDLSGCKKLQTVNTGGSWAKKITLTGCTDLRKLSYHGNAPGALNVSSFRKLTYLDCEGQGIKKLDVSKNKKLKYLNCTRNSIGKLDVRNNKKLKTLYCDNCSLTKLLLAPKAKYKVVSCKNNRIKKLNIKNRKIKTLKTAGNRKIKVMG